MITLGRILAALIAAGTIAAPPSLRPATARGAAAAKPGQAKSQEKGFWPDREASKVVSLSTTGYSYRIILLQTHAVAVKEIGPKATVAKFGEVYVWSPAFFVVRQDEPARIRFWNLQPDDQHDFMLVNPQNQVLMKLLLPPLSDKTYVFIFHKQGVYTFLCTVHQPGMTGQILVLPPARK